MNNYEKSIITPRKHGNTELFPAQNRRQRKLFLYNRNFYFRHQTWKMNKAKGMKNLIKRRLKKSQKAHKLIIKYPRLNATLRKIVQLKLLKK